MQKLDECDSDDMFDLLYKIGIDMEALARRRPSVQRMRELYAALLHLQLIAWKQGESHNELIMTFNKSLCDETYSRKTKRPASVQ